VQPRAQQVRRLGHHQTALRVQQEQDYLTLALLER
jgi:hypothetical protein